LSARWRARLFADAAGAICDLDELGELGDPRWERYVCALELARPPAPVPGLVRGAERVEHLVLQSELFSQRPGHRCMLGDHLGNLAVAGEGELERDPEPVRPRVAGPQPPHPGSGRAEAAELVIVLTGFQRDVVAEPLRLLMGVGMAPDADEQRRVVHVRAPLLIEPDLLGEPQRDQALPQHVLHRLPESKVHPERQRGDELSQPDVRTIGPFSHRPRLPPRPSRKMRRTPHVLTRRHP
jgi:hypothetical protein